MHRIADDRTIRIAPDRPNGPGPAPGRAEAVAPRRALPCCSCFRRSCWSWYFGSFPLFWGFGLSLTSATSTDPGEFIGAGNYLRALDDPNFRSSIANAAVVLLSVPIFVTIPMLLAILIDQGVPGRAFFRSVYFFPAVLSSVIIGSIFSVVLSFNGSLNALLKVVRASRRRLAGAFGDRAAGDARRSNRGRPSAWACSSFSPACRPCPRRWSRRRGWTAPRCGRSGGM